MIIAPQHHLDLAELQPYIIEGVAYSPLKMTYLCGPDRGSDIVYCRSCDWERRASTLPYDSGYVQPDMCPACASRGELGHVRKKPASPTPENVAVRA